MRVPERLMRTIIVGAVAIVAVSAWWLTRPGGPEAEAAGVSQLPPGFVQPVLTGIALEGEAAFGRHCQTCHGVAATGTLTGPPLVHKIYEPGHHGDAAFALAALQGARQHHWPFGDMPPVAGITEPEIVSIIAYVRTLQRANGIE